MIDGEPGSGTMQVNGAAAHLTRPGHKIIVASFGAYDESDLERYSPVVVHVDDDNRAVAVDSHPEVLLTRRPSHELRRRSHTAPPPPTASRSTLPRLAEMKAAGEPIVMVTAYDYPSAQVAEEAGVDIVLVGDTAAMVVLGYPGTEPVSMDEMVMLGKAVRRGLRTPLMVGDMPMGSYESSNELAVQSAQRLVKETGCQVVKLEAGGTSVERARAIVRSGIPVMGHVGLTPQTATALGGYKTQGKTAQDAIKLCEDALALQAVGLLRDRLRGGPGGGHRGDRREAGGPDDRDRRRPGDRRPGARLPRPARDHHGPHGEIRQALRRGPRGDGRRRRPVRRRGPLTPLPRARPRLRRRAGRARRAAPLPRPGEPHLPEGMGLGAAS